MVAFEDYQDLLNQLLQSHEKQARLQHRIKYEFIHHEGEICVEQCLKCGVVVINFTRFDDREFGKDLWGDDMWSAEETRNYWRSLGHDAEFAAQHAMKCKHKDRGSRT